MLVQFRSLHSLARRTLAAGAASALALTLFNAVQPTLGSRPVGPGTLKDVPLSLTPATPVDNAARPPAGSATLPLLGPEPESGSLEAAPRGAAPGAGAREAQPGAGALEAAPKTAERGTAPGAGSVQAAPAVGARVSAPVEVGKARFVGVSWPAPPAGPRVEGADAKVWLRSRTGAGWSSWREVEPASDGPDATSREYRRLERVYSDGQWLDAGTAEVQVKVDPPAAPGAASPTDGLQAHLIAPDMTPTPGTEPPRAGVATAMTTRPAIVSRAAWGARESLRRDDPEYSPTVKAAVVHHTVQSNRYRPSESAALVRADYLYHVRSRGWNDIGYNFLVDRYGRVFEGRYGGVTRAVLGAHAGGFNTNTTGVAMLGTFTTSRPPAAMLAAMQRLLAWKLDLTHVDPAGRTILQSAGGANVRYPAGRKVYASTIIGHRSTSYTTCPGNPTLALLRSIRANVAKLGRPKIYRGTVSTTRVQPVAGVATGVYARFSSKARWRVTITGSHGGTVRSFGGVGSSARVRWSGRTASGALAPPGWATVTVTASAGGRSARPAVSRVFVDRPPPPAGTSTGGFSAGVWAVSNANAEQRSRSSRVFGSYRWGRAGDIPIVGDWDGDGTQTVGVARPDRAGNTYQFLLRNSSGPVLQYRFGRYGDRIVVGDWSRDSDRSWTPAAVRGGVWTLRATNAPDSGQTTVSFGQAGDRYLAGDWDGDGLFTPGFRRGATFSFRNTLGAGAVFTTTFGRADDLGFVGDWNGNGTWTPGVLRAGTRWYLKNSFSGGAAAVGLAKQTPGTPVVGDWDNRP
jgi:N-acetylmuramoyl-L-alanine amidase